MSETYYSWCYILGFQMQFGNHGQKVGSAIRSPEVFNSSISQVNDKLPPHLVCALTRYSENHAFIFH